MKHIWVRYTTGIEDIVHQVMFEELLARGAIAQFYRISESRWITPGVDRTRQEPAGQYVGPERRNIALQRIVVPPQSGPEHTGLSYEDKMTA